MEFKCAKGNVEEVEKLIENFRHYAESVINSIPLLS